MYWRSDVDEDEKGMVEVSVGTFNQDVLLGDRGKTFCIPTGCRVWCCREIKGVTDPGSGYGGGVGEGQGIRYVEGMDGEVMPDN
jgi:hypothetical protein